MSDNNDYLFACTKKSEGHQSGWLALHNVVLKIPKLKKACSGMPHLKSRHMIGNYSSSTYINVSDEVVVSV